MNFHEAETPAVSQRSMVTPQKASRQTRTVLLAEDDDDLRYVMECVLSAMGYVVIACANAQLASLAYRSHPEIDVLLTDFQMPGRTGLELARELTGLCPTLPVMIITGSMLSEQMLQEIEIREWIYVSKPCHLPYLQAMLIQMLRADLRVGDRTEVFAA